MNRSLVVVAILVAVLGGAALAPQPAAAHHLALSTKTCAPSAAGGGAFDCTLTIGPLQDELFDSDTLLVGIGGGTAATFTAVSLGAGTCGGVVLTQTGGTTFQVATTLGCPEGTTIVVQETLAATGGGTQVCQHISNLDGIAPAFVCAAGFLTPALLPTTAEQCKDAGFAAFEAFKNQGDCVAFVQTGGGNEPAGG